MLNIYAFANLHDFSWGTKEQTTSEIDLGITKKVNQNEVDMALPADQSDIGASMLPLLGQSRVAHSFPSQTSCTTARCTTSRRDR